MEARPDWWDDAACNGANPDIFFPERGASVEPARSICRTCPVRTPCLDHAIERVEKFGIWGGLSERERRRVRRDRNDARRAANSAA